MFGIGIEFFEKGLRLLSPTVSHEVESISEISEKQLNYASKKEEEKLKKTYCEYVFSS